MNKQTLSTLILSCAEIELHYKRPLLSSMKHISSSKDAETILRAYIPLNRIDLKEFFWVLLLSNTNRLIGISQLATGTQRSAHVQIREIFQLTLVANASNLIVAHCHPSGNLTVSDADIKLTKKIQKLCDLFDVSLLDHIIITSESYTSFSDTQIL